ncbi:N-acetylmuramoyl-L-alanine amidase [Aliiroseovarius sp. KMU-50]|uniref:N-acetylmuramoyl-L-alanine amidase n=1 Tax=Aliiroseovarius salicola TaxID=3009082 RepID=A0ABT4VYU4_9RHOB|nr:N-acetylmuramoyl-L-alanine amidase [Aliiroseovarius sp. KMU-50]MDA5093381.1 N-acetylmuramoyl-L-alanine amidase [Aliiroseovarius sp. KMU-50]
MSTLHILQRPSPNFGLRREGLCPSLIVLHYTAMDSAEAALERLCTSEFEVSAHYLICRTGTIYQLVDEDMRAWHAGAGEWAGQQDINSRSIGIELDNDGTSPFPEPQMAALEALMSGIMIRWNIPPERVIGHSDMAPGRKVDPGPRFDWMRLAHMALAAPSGHGSAPQVCTVEAFRARARAAGYTSETDDATLLATVRLRHRPWATGPLSPDDISALTV